MAVPGRHPSIQKTIRSIRRSAIQKNPSNRTIIGNWEILEEEGDLVAVNKKTGDKTILANRGES